MPRHGPFVATNSSHLDADGAAVLPGASAPIVSAGLSDPLDEVNLILSLRQYHGKVGWQAILDTWAPLRSADSPTPGRAGPFAGTYTRLMPSALTQSSLHH